jgi:hypothetical protein
MTLSRSWIPASLKRHQTHFPGEHNRDRARENAAGQTAAVVGNVEALVDDAWRSSATRHAIQPTEKLRVGFEVAAGCVSSRR